MILGIRAGGILSFVKQKGTKSTEVAACRSFD